MAPWIKRLVWVCVMAAVAGFVLPWARVDIRLAGVEKDVGDAIRRGLGDSFGVRGRKEPSWIRHNRKKAVAAPTVVSGLQVPLFANRKGVKAATDLMKLFTKTDEQIGLKSWAVWLVPVLAALFGWWLAGPHGLPRQAAAAIAVVSAVVALGGLGSLLMTDTRKAYAIAVGEGLWLSLVAYLGLAVAAAAQVLTGRRREA